MIDLEKMCVHKKAHINYLFIYRVFENHPIHNDKIKETLFFHAQCTSVTFDASGKLLYAKFLLSGNKSFVSGSLKNSQFLSFFYIFKAKYPVQPHSSLLMSWDHYNEIIPPTDAEDASGAYFFYCKSRHFRTF